MDCVPLVALAPVQPPEAVQLVAFVEFQVSVAEAPLATLVGLTLSVTVGAGTAVTVTLWFALPPTPVQVSVNVVVAVSGDEVSLPDVALMPSQPPEAEQLVALVELHVSSVEVPAASVVGLALKETVGAGTTVTVTDWLALPPGPVHVSV